MGEIISSLLDHINARLVRLTVESTSPSLNVGMRSELPLEQIQCVNRNVYITLRYVEVDTLELLSSNRRVTVIIVFFSVIGILGSYGVAWFGIRINTFANSRSAGTP